jgi:hypothetical protein
MPVKPRDKWAAGVLLGLSLAVFGDGSDAAERGKADAAVDWNAA